MQDAEVSAIGGGGCV